MDNNSNGQESAAVDYRARRAAQAEAARKRKLIACAVFMSVVLALGIAVAGFANNARDAAFDALVEQTEGQQPDAQAQEAGAGAEANSGAAAPADEDAASRASASERPLSVVDFEQRTVEVPHEAKHVAVFDSFSGELAVMLGVGDRIAGVPGGVKSDAILQGIFPGLSKVSQLSGSEVNIESLTSMECDLALVRGSLDQSERSKLDLLGIPYVVVDYGTVDDQIAAVRLVGQACGGQAAERAEALAEFYRSTVADVERRLAAVPQKSKLKVYHSINSSVLTDGAGSLGQDWIERCAAVDVSAGKAPTNNTDYEATLEEIYNWDPDVVICSVAQTAQEILSDGAWLGMRAVQDGAVSNLPVGATRWGQRGSVETYLAMMWFGCTYWPEYFSDVDLKSFVTDYYRDYLGVTVDDDLYAAMISGDGIRAVGNGSGGGSGNGSGGGNGSGQRR